jgi:prepilin-type N-terminal cleavage/methylation domain-containing protein
MNKKGFSIMELMVVIGIIAVLASVGLNTYSNVQRNARNTKRKTDLKEVYAALEAFRADNGRYPSTCTDGTTTCAFTTTEWFGEAVNPYGTDPDEARSGATGYIPGLAPMYIPVLPRDPRHGNPGQTSCSGPGSGYLYRSTGTDFKLLAHCTPEGTLDPNDKFFDPCRTTWAWQVSGTIVSRGQGTCTSPTNGW